MTALDLQPINKTARALPSHSRRTRTAPRGHVWSAPEGMAITRLDRTARMESLVLYRITVGGSDHLLYPDEIQDQFGIPAEALPQVCEN